MSFGPRNLVSLILVLLVPAVAFGEVPDITQCQIFSRANEDVSVLICPLCDGYAYSGAQVFGGAVVDATIEVYIRNNAGQGLQGISKDEIRIEHPGLNFCIDGNTPDFDTDENGYTEYALPSCGGGCAADLQIRGRLGAEFFIDEDPIGDIRVNSPDINADLVVDLLDLAAFAQAYFLPAEYCFDYFWDGEMNLQDLAIFATHYGHQCAN